jgi:ABC-2 type transport system ATP-binding protein
VTRPGPAAPPRPGGGPIPHSPSDTGAGQACAVRARGLTKSIRRVPALDRADLDVPDGAVLGLLGPNGSGKTTLLRLLLGLARPDAGTVELLGRPVPRAAGEVLPHVGALVDEPGFRPALTGRANLTRCAAAEPLLETPAIPDAVTGALHRAGLAAPDAPEDALEPAGRAYRTYSPGMRRRLGLAAALLAPRRLMVLDEPTAGLDPSGVRMVRGVLAALHDAGTTVLLSSHQLDEVVRTCTHVAVLSAGVVVAAGPLAGLLEADGPALEVHTPDSGAALAALRAARIPGFREHGRVVVPLRSVDADQVVRTLVLAGVAVHEARRGHTGLEELYVRLTEEA